MMVHASSAAMDHSQRPDVMVVSGDETFACGHHKCICACMLVVPCLLFITWPKLAATVDTQGMAKPAKESIYMGASLLCQPMCHGDYSITFSL